MTAFDALTDEPDDVLDIDPNRLADEVAYRWALRENAAFRKALVAAAQRDYIDRISGNPAHRRLFWAGAIHRKPAA